MKTISTLRLMFIALTAVVTGSSARSAPLFSEDFEAGFARWTGKNGGVHSGVIVPDPMSSGQGSVLTFTNRTGHGDIFTIVAFTNSDAIEISFDYLGLAKTGSVAGDFGGFLGLAQGLPGATERWIAGTINNYPGLAIQLPDDGTWHHVAYTLPRGSFASFHLMVEDFNGSSGVAGDAYFDNIELRVVPTLRCNIYAGVQVEGMPGSTYSIQFSENLPTTNWMTLTNITLSASPYLWFDIGSTGACRRFYRAIELP